MANHASAIKAHRQNLKRRARNRNNRSLFRNAIKRFTGGLETGAADEALLSSTYAIIDKAVKKNAISKNAASRQKSRLTKRLNATTAKADK